ncbi:hypothetical protein C3L33_00781, partial [Rhododendron williamsianum]
MEEQPPVPTCDGGGGGGASLIRDLASCNKTTRDRALRVVLKTWLPSNGDQLSDDEMKKLWKGLFYCLWHADKAPVQLNLIDRLSALLLTLPSSLSLRYLSVFFLTLRREWPGIDSLRLDKFYLLIRRFLHFSFLMLKNNHAWDLDASRRVMDLIEERALLADDDKVVTGNGVSYHVASIFLDELKPFLPLRAEVVDVAFKPFLSVMSKCPDKVLIGKVKCSLFNVLLRMGRNLLEIKKSGDKKDSGDNNEVVVLGTVGLTMGFSAKLYDLGTVSDCVQGNRKVLFSLHEDFLRLEKDLVSSGIEVSIPDAMVDDEDEVPKLIPIATEVEGSTSEVVLESGIKKRKKNKKTNTASDVQLDGANKKTSKKKEKNQGVLEQCSTLAEKENAAVANGIESSGNESNLIFNESVIANLRMQFEKVAEEVALGIDGAASFESPEATIGSTELKKRKRGRSMAAKDTHNQDVSPDKDGFEHASAAAKGSEKSSKKVRFAMKNNLVWKPQTPLPPQDLRLPPSATPRGSALKKGVPAGPIREIPPATKKVKPKKGRKGVKTVSPAIKRLRKLRTLSV